MTVDELIDVLQQMQDLGYGSRVVTQYTAVQLVSDTIEITGAFAGEGDNEVILEAVKWEKKPYGHTNPPMDPQH